MSPSTTTKGEPKGVPVRNCTGLVAPSCLLWPPITTTSTSTTTKCDKTERAIKTESTGSDHYAPYCRVDNLDERVISVHVCQHHDRVSSVARASKRSNEPRRLDHGRDIQNIDRGAMIGHVVSVTTTTTDSCYNMHNSQLHRASGCYRNPNTRSFVPSFPVTSINRSPTGLVVPALTIFEVRYFPFQLSM